MKLPNFSIVILAAGSSSRMGSPKQILQFKGKTLIRHIADIALNSGTHEVIIICGETHDKIAKALTGANVRIIRNMNWQEGIASSIRAGITEVTTDEVILAVCDQPFITAELLQNLLTQKIQNRKAISASSYAKTLGTPACFSKTYFLALTALKNDEGAKKVIMANLDDVFQLEFPGGEVDVDTPEDYKKIS